MYMSQQATTGGDGRCSSTRLTLPVADCPIRTGLASRENLPERLDRLIGEERMPPVVVVFYLGELPATEPPRGSAGIEYRDGPSGMDRDDVREGEKAIVQHRPTAR
jgi:hypothetical protein